MSALPFAAAFFFRSSLDVESRFNGGPETRRALLHLLGDSFCQRQLPQKTVHGLSIHGSIQAAILPMLLGHYSRLEVFLLLSLSDHLSIKLL